MNLSELLNLKCSIKKSILVLQMSKVNTDKLEMELDDVESQINDLT